ncbi:MAG: AI-2E family transporter [Ruminococcus sp.]|nr:AI-2E family transporter [Ruminococcus sp.]
MKFKEFKFKHIMIMIAFAIGLIFFFVYINPIWNVLSKIFTVITPIIYGMVIAYLLNYPYKLFHDKAFKKMGTKRKWLLKVKKPLAMTLAYIIVLGIITYLLVILVPELTKSVNSLIKNIPDYRDKLLEAINGFVAFIEEKFNYNLSDGDVYNNIVKFVTGNTASEFIQNTLSGMLPGALNAAVSVGKELYYWIIGIIISIYLLASRDKLLTQCKRALLAYTPAKFHLRFFKFTTICNEKCGKYIVGKIIDSTIIGVICFIGLSIFKFDYALLISVIVGVTNMIPFFGPIIGAVPCAFLLLIINPMEALWFVVFIVVLQQFDGNILGPKILGETVGISGFWILVSVLIGGGLFGVPGMILAVPVFAVIYTLIEEGVELRERKKAAKVRLAAQKAEGTEQGEDETVNVDTENSSSSSVKNAQSPLQNEEKNV